MSQWSFFKRSWSIFWKYKTLWVFGLLAALGGGGSTNFNFSTPNTNQFNNMPVGGREMLRQIFQSIDLNNLLAIGIVVGIVLFVVSTFARSGLYKMINAIEENQPLSVGAGFSAAGEKFLPLLAVRLMLALPVIILGAITAGSMLSMFSALTSDSGSANNSFNFTNFGSIAGLSGVIIIIGLLASAIGISAERAVVLDDLSVFESIARGWKYLLKNFADYFTIALLWIVVGIGFGIVFACALAPFLLAGLGASLGSLRSGLNITTFTTNLVGPIAIFAVIVGLVLGTFTSVFETSVWTLAYRAWRTTDTPPATAA
jgi:hypothetical protein